MAQARSPGEACVVGGIELVRALGRAGVRSTVVGAPPNPARDSRFAATAIDPGGRPLDDVLFEHASTRPEPPPLFFDADDTVVEVSRARERLSPVLKFLLPRSDVVECLIDKARFQQLAEQLDLPVPPGALLRPAGEAVPDNLVFPLILKPVPYRTDAWKEIAAGAKAIRLDTRAELDELLPRLAASESEFLAQQMVAGTEQDILSYHVYVDASGSVAGEFTGRKIRTLPADFGMSCALVTTDDAAVLRAGRDLVDRLELVGPAKFDFKQAPDGRLFLLEVNTRFTLWVQAGALAGVNLPAIAHADLTGAPRPKASRARPGVRWIDPRNDLRAAREAGVPLHRWIPWAVASESNPAFSWSDLRPLVRRAAHARRRRTGRPAG